MVLVDVVDVAGGLVGGVLGNIGPQTQVERRRRAAVGVCAYQCSIRLGLMICVRKMKKLFS